jgi:NADPH:quinone reductase-like Zn-dependent oxidoreductase
MKALVLDAERRTASVQSIPKPIAGEDEVLVRVQYVALNPVDSLYISEPLGSTGRTIGSDWAGCIIESNVGHLLRGTRVAGFLQGASSVNNRPGAFAEYLVCPSDLLWIVPDSMSLQAASTVSLCALTAAQALFYRLQLPSPFPYAQQDAQAVAQGFVMQQPTEEQPLYFLIYGASTSVGMYAAQLVHHAAASRGLRIVLIGTASRARFSMLRRDPYKYHALVDYRETDWPEQVRHITGGKDVDYVYDCIAEGATVGFASKLLREGGSMAIVRSIEGGAFDIDHIVGNPIYGAVWEAFGVEVQYRGMNLPASPDARAFATAFYRWLSECQPLIPNPVRLMPGGLERIPLDGFVLLGGGVMEDRSQSRSEEWMGRISAEKLVYTVVES